MSLISAVAPPVAPQQGVKRPLLGNPTTVPRSIPAFRGKEVPPGGQIKVPKLSQGNKPNQQTNVGIPYARVCPLEFLSGYCGRVSPGDVAFVDKYHPGFVSKEPKGVGSAGHATMARVLGLDSVNRMLHGSTAPEGWMEGVNVFISDCSSDVIDRATNGAFLISALDKYRLDGIIKSNDEPHSFTSNGSRDAAIFNIVVQGPTLVNNGYLLYDPAPNASDYHSQSRDIRSVEAHPRGSTEGQHHISMIDRNPRGTPWMPDGMYDFVAAFKGTYTPYPMQCFDREINALDRIYVGLRAYSLSDKMDEPDPDDARFAPKKDKDPVYIKEKRLFDRKVAILMSIKKQDGTYLYTETAAKRVIKNGQTPSKESIYFFQYLPMSSRKAWLVDMWNDAQAKGGDEETSFKRMLGLFSRPVQRVVGSVIDDVYDAVREEDLANMVGAWHLGRVLDTRAAKHAPYEGGPSNTGFMASVDVHVHWQNAVPYLKQPTEGMNNLGSGSYEGMEQNVRFVSYGTGTSYDLAKKQRGVDIGFSLRQTLQQSLGRTMGSKTISGASLGRALDTAVRPSTTVPGRPFPANFRRPWRVISRKDILAAYDLVVERIKRGLGPNPSEQQVAAALYNRVEDTVKQIADVKKLLKIAAGSVNMKQDLQKAVDLNGDKAITKEEFLRFYSGPVDTAAPLDGSDYVHAVWLAINEMQEDETGEEGEAMEVDLGSTPAASGASSSLGSSWASLDEAAAPAPAPAPVSAAAAALAPVAHAAVAAAAEARAAKPKGRKSPAKQRAAASTTAPVAAPPQTLLDTPVPPPVAPSASAPAATATAATTDDLSLLGTSVSKPAKPRKRGGETSTVSAVFDSIFGGATDEPDAAPASPTPSSGSESGGPKTFSRRQR